MFWGNKFATWKSVDKFSNFVCRITRTQNIQHTENITSFVFLTTSEPRKVLWLHYLGDKTQIMQIRVGITKMK